jgi:3-hydroxy-D-aspartate aldolase
LQCGAYIFMDADYGRNLDRDGAPTKAFEPSLPVSATVMSRSAADRAIVDAGLQGPRCLDCFSRITICR